MRKETQSTIEKLIQPAKILISSLALVLVPTFAIAESEIRLGFKPPKESSDIALGWEDYSFRSIKRTTRYSLKTDNAVPYIEALSNNAASGLTKEIEIDPKKFPFLSWEWKTAQPLKGATMRSKGRDDSPLRVYVNFGSYLWFPDRALVYVWAWGQSKGTIFSNAYTDRAKVIVVDNQTSKFGSWISHKRNIYEDYKKAFGEEPGEVTSIAVMTDTDNTGGSAISYYRNISLTKQ